MATLLSKSIYCSRTARMALLGLAVLGGAASPLFGQDTVAGRFTLTENTRFGNKILPAGAYKFSIAPVGISQTVDSIRGGRQPVLVMVKPGTSTGPIIGVFAMASRSDHPIDSSKLVLEAAASDGMAMHAMYLDQQRLVLDFDWLSPKDKNPTLASAARPEPATASKTTD
jgi:hypothetical protein